MDPARHREADLFVFLITAYALDRGRSVDRARDRRNLVSGGDILPVLSPRRAARPIPPLLKSVTLLDPQGNAGLRTFPIVESLVRPAPMAAQGRRCVRRSLSDSDRRGLVVAEERATGWPRWRRRRRPLAPSRWATMKNRRGGTSTSTASILTQEVTARYRNPWRRLAMRPPEDWEEVDFERTQTCSRCRLGGSRLCSGRQTARPKPMEKGARQRCTYPGAMRHRPNNKQFPEQRAKRLRGSRLSALIPQKSVRRAGSLGNASSGSWTGSTAASAQAMYAIRGAPTVVARSSGAADGGSGRAHHGHQAFLRQPAESQRRYRLPLPDRKVTRG